RIGNAAGYWGDDPQALERQIKGGPLDYICLDFLAETTMSILQKSRAADPSGGYAHDFVKLAAAALAELLSRKIHLVANAGGVNPVGCAEALRSAASAIGLAPRIAVVRGDDILPSLAELRGRGAPFSHFDTGEPFDRIASRVCAANVYFGAQPI